MTVETVRDDVVRVLRASGELDAAVAPPLLDQVGVQEDWHGGSRRQKK